MILELNTWLIRHFALGGSRHHQQFRDEREEHDSSFLGGQKSILNAIETDGIIKIDEMHEMQNSKAILTTLGANLGRLVIWLPLAHTQRKKAKQRALTQCSENQIQVGKVGWRLKILVLLERLCIVKMASLCYWSKRKKQNDQHGVIFVGIQNHRWVSGDGFWHFLSKQVSDGFA